MPGRGARGRYPVEQVNGMLAIPNVGSIQRTGLLAFALVTACATSQIQERCRLVDEHVRLPVMPGELAAIERVLVDRTGQTVRQCRELKRSYSVAFRINYAERLLPELCARLERARTLAGRGDVSGAAGGPSALPLPGRNNTNFFHVEAHAAQVMRTEGMQQATLYINKVPCAVGPGCANQLPSMLPPRQSTARGWPRLRPDVHGGARPGGVPTMIRANWGTGTATITTPAELRSIIERVRELKEPTMLFLEATTGSTLVIGLARRSPS